jgi:hypothetical protein
MTLRDRGGLLPTQGDFSLRERHSVNICSGQFRATQEDVAGLYRIHGNSKKGTGFCSITMGLFCTGASRCPGSRSIKCGYKPPYFDFCWVKRKTYVKLQEGMGQLTIASASAWVSAESKIRRSQRANRYVHLSGAGSSSSSKRQIPYHCHCPRRPNPCGQTSCKCVSGVRRQRDKPTYLNGNLPGFFFSGALGSRELEDSVTLSTPVGEDSINVNVGGTGMGEVWKSGMVPT